MVGEPGAPRTPAGGCGAQVGDSVMQGCCSPVSSSLGGLLVQDVSCDPKLCSSYPEHLELLLAPCVGPGVAGWAPFVVLCRNSSCQTLAVGPRGLWDSCTGAEEALEPPTSSIRDVLF